MFPEFFAFSFVKDIAYHGLKTKQTNKKHHSKHASYPISLFKKNQVIIQRSSQKAYSKPCVLETSELRITVKAF